MAETEKFDFSLFVSSLKGASTERQQDRVRQELGRMKELVVREPTRRFQQQLYIRRLERLGRFLAGHDVSADLTPSELQAYAQLVSAAARVAQSAGVAAAPAAAAAAPAPARAAPAPVPVPAGQAPAGAPAAAAEAGGAERRQYRRIYMKTRVLIRPEASPSEVVEPLNVSRGGLGFQSAASYALHQIVWTTMNYKQEASELETRSIIVRAAPLPDLGVFSYGVKFLGD